MQNNCYIFLLCIIDSQYALICLILSLVQDRSVAQGHRGRWRKNRRARVHWWSIFKLLRVYVRFSLTKSKEQSNHFRWKAGNINMHISTILGDSRNSKLNPSQTSFRKDLRLVLEFHCSSPAKKDQLRKQECYLCSLLFRIVFIRLENVSN